jgi:hypothetical protein
MAHHDDPEMDLIDQQIQQQDADLAQKRQELFEQRIQIIKGEGNMDWNPQPMNKNPFGFPQGN